ncbi:MAG: type I methionyl aminopeptidase [Chitinivibrionia bacterium]|nr:type I methionyl aminopeptidase [Chitinivibrionia bacterium]
MIVLKSPAEIAVMRSNGLILKECFELARSIVGPGVSRDDINRRVERLIVSKGARPAFKGFQGYPAATCISVNDEVVHGIPDGRELKEGDIVSIDIGVCKDGYYADAARTYAVGGIPELAAKLMRVTQEGLDKGIEQARIGNRLSDISHAVERHVVANGFSVVRALVGHGIGTQMHEEPQVPNFGPPSRGIKLEEGLVLAIEPMVNAGGSDVFTLDDGWTVVTADRSLSAHFEDTIAITKDGPDPLTR